MLHCKHLNKPDSSGFTFRGLKPKKKCERSFCPHFFHNRKRSTLFFFCVKKINFIIEKPLLLLTVFLLFGCKQPHGPAEAQTINIAEIPGVTIPVHGEIPVSEISETAQYTGTITWSPGDSPFNNQTVYIASINLTAKSGYTLNGVTQNFFTVAGANVVINDPDSGLVTAFFPETNTYNIGDTGPNNFGIVFYVTDGGKHGLVAAPEDLSESKLWIYGGLTLTTANGGTSTEIGTGLANTNAIINQSGHSGSAAQQCKDYTGGDFTDWFLPSKDELNAIWDNLVNDGSGSNNGIGSFEEDYYWSSSEYSALYAHCQSFTDGGQDTAFKSGAYYVRPVRAF